MNINIEELVEGDLLTIVIPEDHEIEDLRGVTLTGPVRKSDGDCRVAGRILTPTLARHITQMTPTPAEIPTIPGLYTLNGENPIEEPVIRITVGGAIEMDDTLLARDELTELMAQRGSRELTPLLSLSAIEAVLKECESSIRYEVGNATRNAVNLGGDLDPYGDNPNVRVEARAAEAIVQELMKALGAI